MPTLTPTLRPTLTILSNGYGEDSIGAKLARAWLEQQPMWRVQAYPIVDAGNAYQSLGIPILGERKVMPSGGLFLHHPQLFWQDMLAGVASMTARQWLQLSQLPTDVLVAVGDVYALGLAQLVRAPRFFLQTLVSAHHYHEHTALNRQTMEKISWLERYWMRHSTQRSYVRDSYTAQWLQEHGVRQARALGNPMMDDLHDDVLENDLMENNTPTLALLAGTRSYAPLSLAMMLESLKVWGQQQKITTLVAWARPLQEIDALFRDWIKGQDDKKVHARGLVANYRQAGATVHILQGRFSAIVHAADIIWGTAGTANEQAAGLGKPVLSFVLEPHYRASFLANQQRLLGAALHITQPEYLVRDSQALLQDKARYQHASQQGKKRMGAAGGTQRIINDICQQLQII